MKNYKAIAGNFKDYIRQTFKKNGKAICIVLALQIVFSIGLGILYPNVNKVIYSIVAGAGIVFDIFIFMMLLNNKNFWKVLWKYIIVGLGCLWGLILFILISGITMFFVVKILLWIGFFIGFYSKVIAAVELISVLYPVVLLFVVLLAVPYTIICIFDCIKNDISTISSISKQVELGLSNKMMLFFISISVIVWFGAFALLSGLIFTGGANDNNIALGLQSIWYYGYIIIAHFIFTQLEAKYEVSQKEPGSMD